MTFQKIPQEDYDKAKGQFMLQLHGIFQPYMMYGFQNDVPSTKIEVVALAELF